MQRVFIETEDFKLKIEEIAEPGILLKIQNEILKNPEGGDLVEGSGGLRKIRIGFKGKGKSGGIRVFYLDIPTKEKCFLIFILEKSDSENISAAGKIILRNLARQLKQ